MRFCRCGMMLAAAGIVVLAADSMGQATPREVTVGLESATIDDLQAAMEAGTLTSVRLVEMYLARIAAYDDVGPALNAVLTLNPDALATSERLDEERRRSGPRSPMHGVPVLLKDNIDTADMPTTGGSVTLRGSVPAADAFVVRRLREAGAIILGKVNLSEFATPAGRGAYSSLNGVTLNPHDLRRDPSGSSGGTATSIAANFATVGLGTDTGGSVRLPVAATGLVGVRPTYGLVSRTGIIPQAPSLDTAGPMARNVTDAAITLGILVGEDPADPNTAAVPSGEDYTRLLNPAALRGARLGIMRDFFGGNDEVDSLMVAAIGAMASAGAIIVDPVTVDPEVLSLMGGLRSRINSEFMPYFEAYLATLAPGFPRTLEEVVRLYEVIESPNPVNPGLIETHRRNLEIAGLDRPEYRDAVENGLPRVREAIRGLMEAHRLDALVFPTSRCTASTIYTIEDPSRECRSGPSATSIASYTGFPDVQVPAGFTSDGLPATVSFVGPAFSEARLLGFAFAFEQATRHWRLSPLVPPLAGETIR